MSIRSSAFGVGIIISITGLVGACASLQQRVQQHEDNLVAAGFIMRPANTPERAAMLKRLPPHRFVTRIKGDSVHYVYADPLVCGCLYVGTQQAYAQYKRHEQEKDLADEQQMSAETYADAAWNWQAWGPWGGPGFGFVYSPGFGW